MREIADSRCVRAEWDCICLPKERPNEKIKYSKNVWKYIKEEIEKDFPIIGRVTGIEGNEIYFLRKGLIYLDKRKEVIKAFNIPKKLKAMFNTAKTLNYVTQNA